MKKPFHIVILGAETPVGKAVTEQAQAQEISFHAIHTTDWDLTDLNKLQVKLNELEPQFVVNCIFLGVGGVTVNIASVLSQCCSALNIALVQLSSNHVFANQDGEIFSENDEPEPQTEKGQQVLAVERAIRSSLEKHILLRIGWLFSSQGEDEVSKLLDLAQNNTSLALSDSKFLCPTSACDIAAVLLAVVHQCRYAKLWGTYHYCSAEITTLYKFAEVVVAEARQYEDLKVESISADASSEMNSLFSESSPKLVTKKILYTFGIKPKPWRQALSRILKKRYRNK
ncbi:sugar nucleotide-binding protein [Oceaniserpentilla sp. 4NH20-0058]|uniref:sugar nucleotide-binding protein n=1 Tax=Oceaniserpentilla sp. 4NH20-0058 TaxID=3127660 RepID=UPI0031026841